MPYKETSLTEIHNNMLARVQSTSVLSDSESSSVLNAILGSISDEIHDVQLSLFNVANSFNYNTASGAYLDARAAELPGTGLSRTGPTAAAGAVLQVTRSSVDSTSALLLPAGSVFSRSDNPTISYTTSGDVLIPANQLVYPDLTAGQTPISLICSTTGAVGNAPAGVITTVDQAPGNIVGATNTVAITGGVDLETDSSLRTRIKLYLSSLARCQRSALRYLALTFTSSEDVQFRHAAVYEDPKTPGIVELVVDDGTTGTTADGQTITGTISANLSPILYHTPAAVEPIKTIKKTTSGNTDTIALSELSQEADNWTSIHERGVLILGSNVLKSGALASNANELRAGDTYEISGYSVYTKGIAELQALIEGNPTDVQNNPGYRAAGVRVKVVPPTYSYLSFDSTITAEAGADLVTVYSNVKNEIIAFMADLAPGDTLFMSQLISHVVTSVEGLLSINFQASGTSVDTAPPNARTALRTTSDNLTVG